MTCTARNLACALAFAAASSAPLVAGPVDTASLRGESSSGNVADALSRAANGPWLTSDGAKLQLRSARDIVIDTRRRTLMVFAVPAKHRKVVAMLQRVFADPADKPATSLAPKIPPKPAGPMSTYKYQGEKLSTIIRDLAAEASLNLVIRGPEPTQLCDLTFKNVATKDLLKLVLDIYNFNYQMSPNGETLVIFCGPTHRVMESYSVPAKVSVPLEEIAQALQSTILDVDEPYGPPVYEPGGASGGAAFSGGAGGGGGAPGDPGVSGEAPVEMIPGGASDAGPVPPPAPEPAAVPALDAPTGPAPASPAPAANPASPVPGGR